jgi:hypothetical protein
MMCTVSLSDSSKGVGPTQNPNIILYTELMQQPHRQLKYDALLNEARLEAAIGALGSELNTASYLKIVYCHTLKGSFLLFVSLMFPGRQCHD